MSRWDSPERPKSLAEWGECFNELSPEEAARMLADFDEYITMPPFTKASREWMRKCFTFRSEGNVFDVEAIRRQEEAAEVQA